jgi:hypothetical protein
MQVLPDDDNDEDKHDKRRAKVARREHASEQVPSTPSSVASVLGIAEGRTPSAIPSQLGDYTVKQLCLDVFSQNWHTNISDGSDHWSGQDQGQDRR